VPFPYSQEIVSVVTFLDCSEFCDRSLGAGQVEIPQMCRGRLCPFLILRKLCRL